MSVVGSVLVAVRGNLRWLPDNIELKQTDFGNWSMAIGKIGCRSVFMFTGFSAFGKVDRNGTIDWQSNEKGVWIPEPSYTRWERSWFWPWTDSSEDLETYDTKSPPPLDFITDTSMQRYKHKVENIDAFSQWEEIEAQDEIYEDWREYEMDLRYREWNDDYPDENEEYYTYDYEDRWRRKT